MTEHPGKNIPSALRQLLSNISFPKIRSDPETATVRHDYPLRYAGDRHIITIAPSRSGKGTTAIIPTLLDYDASVLVIDPKGQNTAVTAARRRAMGHEVIVINPFGLHSREPWKLPRHRFNPLAAINPRSANVVADVSSLCEALIINDGKDPHWTNSARDLVSAIIMDLMTRPGEVATLPQMRKILTLPEDLLKERLELMATSPAPFVAQRASRFLGASREIQSIFSTAITQTGFLDDPAIAASLSGNDFRFWDMKTKKLSVFLVLPSRYIAAYSRFLRLFVVSAIDAFLSTPKGPGEPVLVILDEFASLGHLSAIETGMALAAGFGVRLWPILQDINQAKDIYDNRWETFLANAGVIQLFTPNDSTTAEYFSKRCGNITKMAMVPSISSSFSSSSSGATTSKSDSFNLSYVSRPLIFPQELISLAFGKALLFHSGMSDPMLIDRQPYYRQNRFQGLYAPDPYHIPYQAPPPPPQRAEQSAVS